MLVDIHDILPMHRAAHCRPTQVPHTIAMFYVCPSVCLSVTFDLCRMKYCSQATYVYRWNCPRLFVILFVCKFHEITVHWFGLAASRRIKQKHTKARSTPATTSKQHCRRNLQLLSGPPYLHTHLRFNVLAVFALRPSPSLLLLGHLHHPL